jgi:hypothetical protein
MSELEHATGFLPSCDQAIFVDQATGASLPSNVVLLKVDPVR